MPEIASLLVRLGADISAFSRGLTSADTGISTFGRNAGSSISGLGLKLTAGLSLPLAAAGIAATNTAIEWESAFAGVVKTVEASQDELTALESQLRDMATDETNPVAGLDNAHVTLARIAELAGSLGIATADIDEFTQTIAELDMSSDLTAESAATMAAQFANVTGMDMSNIEEFGSTVVDLGNKMATTEPQLLEFAQRMAAAGENADLSEQEILAFAASLASLGLDPEAGGTAFSQTMNMIVKAAAEGGDKLDILATTAGTTADSFRTNWETDPAGAFVDFLEGLDELDPADRIAALDELGLSGVRVSDALTRMSNNTQLVSDALNIANEAWSENTALTTEAQTRFKTTESQLNLLENNVKDLGISVGDALLPAINDIVGAIVPFIQNIADTNPELLRLAIGVGIAAIAAGPLLTVLGGIVSVVSLAISPIGLLALAVGVLAAVISNPSIQDGLKAWGDVFTNAGIIIGAVLDNIAVGFRTVGRDLDEFVTRARIAVEDINIARSLGTDTDAKARREEFVLDVQGIETAENLETQIRDSLAAGDLSIDMSQFVTTDPAAIAEKIVDPNLIQTAINTALAEGDEGAVNVLLPIASELGLDVPDIEGQFRDAITTATEKTYTAEIKLDATIQVGNIFTQMANAVTGATVGMGAGQFGVNTDNIRPFHTGGTMQNEGLALLKAGEVVLNPAESRQYQNAKPGASIGALTIQTNSADDLLFELRRRGIDLVTMAQAS